MSDSFTVNVSWKGSLHPIIVTEGTTLRNLKEQIETILHVPIANQKLLSPLLKKSAKDDDLLIEFLLSKENIKTNKITLIGSTREEVESVQNKTTEKDPVIDWDPPQEPWEQESKHQRIVRLGPLEGSMQGKVDVFDEPLPENRTIGYLRNFMGAKTRMVFKYDHLVFHTDSGSIELPFDDILDVQSQQITDHPGYSIVLFKTNGSHVSKMYHLYFVPNQFLNVIKGCGFTTTLGSLVSQMFNGRTGPDL